MPVLTTWTCHCGQVFRSWRAAERHTTTAHHGGRISIAVPSRRPA